jgi:hypothetical protein
MWVLQLNKLSIIDLVPKDKKLLSGILFAVLLNFKHIYMYIAVRAHINLSQQLQHFLQPAYFVYLLRAYCMTPTGAHLQTITRSLSLSPFRITVVWQFRVVGPRSSSGFCCLLWTICAHGSNSSSSISFIPIHTRIESRLLGSECMGTGYRC